MKFLDPSAGVPWYRVVSSTGKISSRGPGTTGAQRQKEELEAEGIEITITRENEFLVKLGEYGWFPEVVNFDDDENENIESTSDAEAETEVPEHNIGHQQ